VPTNLADWLSGQDAERMLRYRELLDFYEGNRGPGAGGRMKPG